MPTTQLLPVGTCIS